MPLPDNGVPWPPPATAGPYHLMAEHDAWYSGDPDALTAFYTSGKSMARERPAQRAGGVVGAVARWWWGTPTTASERRAKLHVPVPADIAAMSADLLFAAPLELKAEDNDGLQQFLDDLIDGGLSTTLHEGAEVGAALGGFGLAARWDKDASDTAWLEVIHADCVHPTYRQGRLVSVLFAQRLPSSTGTVWRQLEVHEPGRIFHGLYAGTEDRLGRAMPLQDHPATEHLAPLVAEDGGYATDVQGLTATYVPNMRPNRLHRGSPLGRSDFAGIEPTFDALDEAYSSWHRDIRLGKARIFTAQSALEVVGPGQPGMLDTDREVMVGLHTLARDQGNGLPITPQQFAIRYQEHADTVRDWTNMAVRSAGYSVSTLGESGDVAMTATEAEQRERRSYLTRAKKVRYVQPELRRMLEVLVDLTNAHLSGGIPEGDMAVELGKPSQDTPLGLANTAQALSAAQAASTKTLVQMVHPDWTLEQVDEEVGLIMDANRLEALPLPDGLPDDAGV